MGENGAKLTGVAGETAAGLVDDLQPLGNVTSKKMFGGYGVFGDGVMFAIVDSGGQVFLKVGDGNQAAFEAAGTQKHGRMPYYSVPDEATSDPDAFLEWAGAALEVAKAAKK